MTASSRPPTSDTKLISAATAADPARPQRLAMPAGRRLQLANYLGAGSAPNASQQVELTGGGGDEDEGEDEADELGKQFSDKTHGSEDRLAPSRVFVSSPGSDGTTTATEISATATATTAPASSPPRTSRTPLGHLDMSNHQFQSQSQQQPKQAYLKCPPARNAAAAAAAATKPPMAAHRLAPRSSSSSGNFRQSLAVVLLIAGLIICVSSMICLLLLPTFVSQQISKRLVLRNNSLLLERWSKPNVPMHFKVWLFDVKNAHELVQNKLARPQVEEIGPFVFNLRRRKDVISFAGDNLYYTERKIYQFNRELSCCAINHTVVVPNIPLVAVVDRALALNLPIVGRLIPRLINRAIQSLREQLFVRKQVGELLFDGYEVDLLKMVSRIGSLVGLPQQSQRFGLLRGRNDSWRPEQDGVWAVNTGARDRTKFGRVSSWNSFRQLPFWPAAQCNAINGSDGTLFPPPIRRGEPLYIFNPELCRTVSLTYDRTSSIHSIEAYRFVLSPLNFAHTMGRSTPHQQQQLLQTGSLGPTGGGDNLISNQNGPSKPAGAGQQPSVAGAAAPAAAPARPASPQRASTADLGTSSSERSQVGAPRDPKESADNHSSSINQQTRHVQEAQSRDQQRHDEQQQQQQLPETPRNPQTCFCDRKTTNLNGINVCEFDGLMDLSRCSKQAQVIFGSLPHFHNSDPRLRRQVDGLRPNGTKHTTYLDIEPNTGLVLGGRRRVQLNLLIKHNNQVEGFENINDMLLPVVWFEESATIPEESAQKFRSLYTDRIRLINLVLLSLLVASVALIAIDARLLLASRCWRTFKLQLQVEDSSWRAVGQSKGQVAGQPAGRDSTRDEDKKRRRRRRRRPTNETQSSRLSGFVGEASANENSSNSNMTESTDLSKLSGGPAPGPAPMATTDTNTTTASSSSGRLANKSRSRSISAVMAVEASLRPMLFGEARGRPGAAIDAADERASTKRSDSPLLLDGSDTNTSGGSSPASSPELRKLRTQPTGFRSRTAATTNDFDWSPARRQASTLVAIGGRPPPPPPQLAVQTRATGGPPEQELGMETQWGNSTSVIRVESSGRPPRGAADLLVDN